jgi:hypothetical protein
LGAQLVDVRDNPFSYCGCGEALDFLPVAGALVM